jgi:protein transport protein SEC24
VYFPSVAIRDSFLTPPPTQPGLDSSMLVVSDIDDVFLPKPTDLLVNLAESRSSLEALLGRVNDMFQENSIIGSAMSPALQAGFKLMVRFPFFYSDNVHH